MINTKAILVNVTIHKRTEFRVDKRVRKEVSDTKHVTNNAGTYRKRIYHASTLSNINAIANRLHEWLRRETVEWGGGYRLLPVTNLMEFRAEFRKLQNKFDAAVEMFIQRQPEYKQAAQLMLKDMYFEGDYPTPDEIRKDFSITATLAPLPDNSADFRLQLSEVDMDAVRKDIQNDLTKQYEKITEDLFLRVKRIMGVFIEKLEDPKLADSKSSFIKHAEELVKVLPSLNFMEDPRLTDLIQDIQDIVANSSLQTLKNDANIRLKTREDIQNILGKLNDYGY